MFIGIGAGATAVAQTSNSAVSRVSEPANRSTNPPLWTCPFDGSYQDAFNVPGVRSSLRYVTKQKQGWQPCRSTEHREPPVSRPKASPRRNGPQEHSPGQGCKDCCSPQERPGNSNRWSLNFHVRNHPEGDNKSRSNSRFTVAKFGLPKSFVNNVSKAFEAFTEPRAGDFSSLMRDFRSFRSFRSFGANTCASNALTFEVMIDTVVNIRPDRSPVPSSSV